MSAVVTRCIPSSVDLLSEYYSESKYTLLVYTHHVYPPFHTSGVYTSCVYTGFFNNFVTLPKNIITMKSYADNFNSGEAGGKINDL